MADSTYDLIVVRTGSGGAPAAFRCAADGWSVGIVDERPYGGTCALRGCDPKNILREKALGEARRDAQMIYYSLCTHNPFARTLVEFFDEQDTAPITLNLNPVESTS